MNLRPFEIGLIGFFMLAALGGLVFVSVFKGGDDGESLIYGEQVVIWGTLEKEHINAALAAIKESDAPFKVVSYRQVDEQSFDSELLNAIAEGRSPDLVLIPHTILVTYRSKLTPIPAETLNTRTIRDTYIDGVEVFLRNDGTYALPFAVDPLVLYWNRDLFSAAGLAQPPKTWESLMTQSIPALTKLDAGREVVQSAIALGEYRNIRHAQKILSMLLFQAGTAIVEEDENDYLITLGQGAQNGVPPAHAALSFYAQFANPGSSSYTWNRLKSVDRNSFTGGTLAMYLGLGSEIRALEDANPNLSFDVATVPQAQGATAQRNYGIFYGFAIPKASKNVSGAYRAASVFTQAGNVGGVTEALGLTPVHRALYTGTSVSTYGDVLESAALIARGWLNPASRETEELFETMIEGAKGGSTAIPQVMTDAVYTLENLFR